MPDPTTDPAQASAAPSKSVLGGDTTKPNPSSLTVIQLDGSTAAPKERQQQLLQAARQAIEADPHFASLSGATLARAEVNAGLSESQRGYLYLRYDVPGATPQEFWAHVADATAVKWKSGQVGVTLP